MTKTQALAQLQRLLGPRAAIRDTRKATSPEERDRASALRAQATADKQKAHDAMEAREVALLKADAEYQRLATDYQKAVKAHHAAPFPQYRYTALTTGALFNTVEGEADTPAALVAEVKRRRAARGY